MPIAHADKNPVAKARSNPNHSPNLPEPQGRLEFSWNPFKMLLQLVGPALRRKIKCYCCMAAVCAFIVAIFPVVIANVMTKIYLSVLTFGMM